MIVIDLNSGGLTVNVPPTAVPVTEILTDVTTPTGTVLIANVPDVAPPATLQDVTAAAVLLLDSAIVIPALGAGPLNVSVPVDGLPPMTAAGLILMLTAAGAVMVSLADAVDSAVVMVTVVSLRTGIVVIVNVPVLAPPATVATVTFADASLAAMAIVSPPLGAAALSVTDPAADLLPSTLVGLSLIAVTTGGIMVSVAPAAVPETVIFAAVCAATGTVVTVNVPVVLPPETMHVLTVAAGSLLESWNVMPVDGAADPSVNVPVEVLPPVTEVGLSVIPAAVGGVMVSIVSILVPVADILAAVAVPTGVVFTVNVPVFALPATEHDVTVAAGSLLDSGMINPAAGAVEPSVNVPVDLLPPVTDIGASEMAVTTGGTIVRFAVADEFDPARDAVIAVVVDVATGIVDMVAVPVVFPACTVSVAEGIAAVEALFIATLMPPAGAAVSIVTVAVELSPPVTDAGESSTDVTEGGVSVSVRLTFPL